MSKVRHTLGTLWRAWAGLRWAVTLLVVSVVSAWQPTSAVAWGGDSPTLGPSSLPDGTVNVAYSQTFSATGGSGSYTYERSSGTLPTGLTFDASAHKISGTPTAHGSWTFTIKVTDGNHHTDSQQYTVAINWPPLSLGPSSLPDGTVNVAYSQTFSATGGSGSYTYEKSSGTLPTGLTLDASAHKISGTPTAHGSWTFTIKVTDTASNTDSQQYTVAMDWPPLSLGPSSLPDGTVNVAYSQTFSATGGSGGYTYEKSSGTLPTGLTFDASAHKISGTPTAHGSWTFTIKVTDSDHNTKSQQYTMAINWPPLSLGPSSLPDGTVNVAYSQTFTATGGSGGYTYEKSSGTLPTGLTFDASAHKISGTPTAHGSWTFTIKVTDSDHSTDSQQYSIDVDWADITLSPSSLRDGTVGSFYSQTVSASGGSGSYTKFEVTSGSLPNGLSLDSVTGRISGTPTTECHPSITIRVTDSASNTGSKQYSIDIDWAEIRVTPSSLPDGTVGVAYSATIGATGGTGSYTKFQVTSGSLPAGLSLNSSTGVISGTPTTATDHHAHLTITVTDSSHNTGHREYDIDIDRAPIAVTPYSLNGGSVNSPYSATIGATGGTGSYTKFEITSGSLPAGLSLNATSGAISGTPTTQGNSNFTIKVTDSCSHTGSRAYTLEVAAAGAIVISPASLPEGVTGVTYSQTITASGYVSTCTFSVASGLPSGLSLNPTTGVLSGTPTASGTFNFTVTAAEGTNSSHKDYSIVIYNPIAVTPAGAPSGAVGAGYSATFGATGGNGHYTSFALTAGALPPGLAWNSASHTIAGIPTSIGRWTFTLTARDSIENSGSHDYTIDIAEGRIEVEVHSESMYRGHSGAPYSGQVVVNGGLPPYQYMLDGGSQGPSLTHESGSLPPGLTLDRFTGAISGTPTRSGEFSFNVRVIDAANEEAVALTSITIEGGSILAVAPASLPSSLLGMRYAASVSASGGVAPYTFAIVGGALPTGLVLDPATGAISGTSTAAGVFHFTVKATDRNGDFGTRDYSVEIANRPDPSQDAEVRGLVDSQMQAALRFAGAQIDNVMQHLVGLRESFGCGVHPDITLNVSPTRPPASEGASDPAAATVASNALNQAVGHALEGDCDKGAHRSSVWTSGSIDYDSGRSKLSATGLTVGYERQLSRSLILGAAIGAGFDRDNIGSNGTKSNSSALNFMAYGAYRLGKRVFFEAMGGYSKLNSDNTRFVTLDGSLLDSKRPGHAMFTSVSIGTQLRAHGFSASPYLRNDLISASLDAYQEGGVTPFALGFARARQTVDVLVAGSRLTYTVRMPWGRISPLARVEYRHRFASSYVQSMFYADHPEMTYDLQGNGQRHNSASAAAGAEVAVWGLIFDLEYSAAGASLDNFSDHALRGSVRLGF
jgi:large repetitive protein